VLTSLRAPKPHFAKQLWITAGTFLSVYHTNSKQGAFEARISCSRRSFGGVWQQVQQEYMLQMKTLIFVSRTLIKY
jgi:hypothetical protein